MKKKDNRKLFVVKKYIWANHASEAIRKDKTQRVDDVWVDEDWKKTNSSPKDAIGFYQPDDESE